MKTNNKSLSLFAIVLLCIIVGSMTATVISIYNEAPIIAMCFCSIALLCSYTLRQLPKKVEDTLIGKRYQSKDNSFSQRLDKGGWSDLAPCDYNHKTATPITILIEPFCMEMQFEFPPYRKVVYEFVIGIDDNGIRHICLYYPKNIIK